jgi:hypothetical protein
MSTPEFCPLCDVSLDLHDGPGTCHLAAQRESIVALPFALIERGRR